MTGLVAFLAGALFAVGLAVSGMTRPSKVIGFLDFGGRWDAALLVVMAAAVSASFAGNQLARRRAKPLLAETFSPIRATRIDARLIAGAAIFGLGWGLSGLCPGPAVVGLAAATRGSLFFVPAMVVGMALHAAWPAFSGTSSPPSSSAKSVQSAAPGSRASWRSAAGS
jgi:uncharacterized membrane protein YedE/YeeE